MPLISSSVPNLTGGVSQQPTSQRGPNQCEEQENAIPLVVGGLIKRPPTNHVSELKSYGTDGTDGSSLNLSSAFTHFVNRDETEQFFITLDGDDNIHVNGFDGSPKQVFKDITADSYFTASDPRTAFKAVTVADTTFIINTEKAAAMAADTTAASVGSNEALLWITKTGPYFQVKVEYGSDTATQPASPDAEVSSTTAIATGLAATINGWTGVTAVAEGSVIYMTGITGTLTVEDTLGNSGHITIVDKAHTFSDLPPVAKHGQIVKVEGEPSSEIDDYYVKFETNSGSAGLGEGLWTETTEPGIKYLFNYDTMPHVIVRQANGSFVLKKADGAAPSSGDDSSVTWSDLKYTPREVGSDITNPLPSFIGFTINDITFYKNRLVFLSGENCILSEAGEFFNLFRTTTSQLLDSDVIDVGVGGTKVSKLEIGMPFNDRLLLFSKQTQFVLQGETILSPKTASITQITNFDIITDIEPTLAGNVLFFPFNRGSFSGVREYFKNNDTDINYDAVEVTAQVPKYIPGFIRKMTISTTEDILAILSRTKTGSSFNSTNELYLYKYFNTSQGRLQSAWFKFTFSNCEIVDIEFVDESLYLVIKRGSKTFLERMDLQTGLVDTGSTYTTMLDRRAKITGNGADTPAAGSVINLPYTIESGDTMTVCDSTGETRTIASQSGTQITLTEEFAADEVFYVGLTYTMKYEITPPVLKSLREGGMFEVIATGRHQLRYMTVVFDETAYFSVRFSTRIGGGQYSDTTEYPYSGRYLSTGGFLGSVPSETGNFRFPVFAESDTVKIEILNDSPLPSNIQALEFEAYYTSRSQRM